MGIEDASNRSLTELERPEERLRHQAVEISGDAEGILQRFTDLSTRGDVGLRPWEGLLFTSIKARLNDTQDQRYLLGLRQAVRGASGEKERIVAAAYAYELSDWENMKQRPAYYNRRVLFRSAMELAESEAGLVGEVARIGLARIPLVALKEALALGKDRNVNDPSWLATVAYARREGKEEEDAKKTLQEVRDNLFAAKSGRAVPRDARALISHIDGGGYDINHFSIPVIEYIFRDLQTTDPDFFEATFQVLKEEEKRILAKGIVEDKKDFDAFLATLPRGEYYSTYQQLRNTLITLRKLFAKIPILSERHARWVEEGTRREQAAAADRARLAREQEAAQALAAETERTAREAARRQAEEERGERRKTEAKVSYDRLLEAIPAIDIDFSLLDGQMRARAAEEIPTLLWNLYQSFEWRILRCPGRPRQTLSDLDRLVSEVSWQHLLSKEPEPLTQAWETRRSELNRQIEDRLDANVPLMLEAIEQRFSFQYRFSDRRAREGHLYLLDQMIQSAAPRIEFAREERAKRFLTQLVELLRRKRGETDVEHQRQEREDRLREREGEITSIREEYLRETIERQIEYLKRLYEASLGISLPPVGSRASHEEGDVVGSVSFGLSLRQSIRHEMRLEHRLDVLAERDAIELEMGESIESLLARRAMVDWIVPHEVAHLIDFKNAAIATVLEQGVPEVRAKLLRDWRGEFPALAREVLPHVLNETAIDGIGFRLLTEYGVSDPAVTSRPARIEAAMQGYAAMTNVIRQILQTHADTPEMKARYAILLLRNRANGEFLLEEMGDTEVRPNVLTDMQVALRGFEEMFATLNAEVQIVHDEQVLPVVEICKTVMRNAKEVPLEKWAKNEKD